MEKSGLREMAEPIERFRMSQRKMVPPGDSIMVLEIGEIKLQKKFKILPHPEIE